MSQEDDKSVSDYFNDVISWYDKNEVWSSPDIVDYLRLIIYLSVFGVTASIAIHQKNKSMCT